MIERRFQELWSQLQGRKPYSPHFLTEVQLQGIRGIKNLKVKLDYPVSVIAGSNGSGKSTVLFAAACAYKVPVAGPKDFVPSTLFPNYYPKGRRREDHRDAVVLNFEYETPKGHRSMRWQRSEKGRWSKSFYGRKDVKQPERPVYLRTLSNISNPSEVRGVLSMSRSAQAPKETFLTPSQVEFAHQMLPFRYSEVVNLSSGSKDLLFATQEGGDAYSELHMSSGERAILRLSQEVAQLKDALILVDELEAGLHPWLQQLLMLQLQQLALRNDLQVIITTHSPVVLDSVPENGRIFLERDKTGAVTVQAAYRDIIQNALYGRSKDALNLLCEDKVAEGILEGVLDVLRPKLELETGSVHIGRDTGADEFPSHAAGFKKFNQIDRFVFVLDGDKRDSKAEELLRKHATGDSVLFLPGDLPEAWMWKVLKQFSTDEAEELGLNEKTLKDKLDKFDSIYNSTLTPGSRAETFKSKLRSFTTEVNRTESEVARVVGRLETGKKQSDIQPLVEKLQSALLSWRSR